MTVTYEVVPEVTNSYASLDDFTDDVLVDLISDLRLDYHRAMAVHYIAVSRRSANKESLLLKAIWHINKSCENIRRDSLTFGRHNDEVSED